jgi:hypothetical protein
MIEPDWQFRVIINSRDEHFAHDVDHAWEIIGRQHIGACYYVEGLTPEAKEKAHEFIPY